MRHVQLTTDTRLRFHHTGFPLGPAGDDLIHALLNDVHDQTECATYPQDYARLIKILTPAATHARYPDQIPEPEDEKFFLAYGLAPGNVLFPGDHTRDLTYHEPGSEALGLILTLPMPEDTRPGLLAVTRAGHRAALLHTPEPTTSGQNYLRLHSALLAMILDAPQHPPVVSATRWLAHQACHRAIRGLRSQRRPDRGPARSSLLQRLTHVVAHLTYEVSKHGELLLPWQRDHLIAASSGTATLDPATVASAASELTDICWSYLPDDLASDLLLQGYDWLNPEVLGAAAAPHLSDLPSTLTLPHRPAVTVGEITQVAQFLTQCQWWNTSDLTAGT